MGPALWVILGLPPVTCPTSSVWSKQQRRGWHASGSRMGKSRIMAATGAAHFPCDYEELMQQVKVASKAALADSKKLLEIEFPTAGLDSVPGDAEGGVEMTRSMMLIRKFCQTVVSREQAASVRIFFPDSNEVVSAQRGVFEGTRFQLDYLTKPSGLEDFGLGGFGKKLKMADRTQDNDDIFVVAYPYFNVNEMLAVEELFEDASAASGRPIIVFNGELDRIRSGYYPAFFYPKLAALAKTFLPKFETAYYIHNFKGRQGGALFRMYPGPWQVLRRGEDDKYIVLHEQSTMPSLKEVALNILPFLPAK